jgi:transglutaminase-like putative cysteine protease
MLRARVGWLRKPYPHVLLTVGMIVTGCVSSPSSLLRFQTPFPPQKVIEDGDYRGFLAENQRSLSKCGGWTECDVTLFNLGFVYAFPQSPYRDPQKARQYLRELYRRYPQSPWTSQGQVLLAFMNEQVSLEEAQRRLRADLRARDASIRKLQGLLNRSREIDIEIEKRERELLR